MADDMAGEDVKTLFTSADGPPLGFDAADIIERGGKLRRRRKRLAVLGSAMTTAAAVVVIALTSVHRGDQPAPIQPAGPRLSIETTSPTPTPPTQAPAAPKSVDTGARPEVTPIRTERPTVPPLHDPSAEASKSKAAADAKVRTGTSRTLSPAPPSATP